MSCTRVLLPDPDTPVTTVIAQIEDPSALAVVDDIARVDGIDALFVGRGDLAAAMGESSPEAPAVRAASERVAQAARAAGQAAHEQSHGRTAGGRGRGG